MLQVQSPQTPAFPGGTNVVFKNFTSIELTGSTEADLKVYDGTTVTGCARSLYVKGLAGSSIDVQLLVCQRQASGSMSVGDPAYAYMLQSSTVSLH